MKVRRTAGALALAVAVFVGADTVPAQQASGDAANIERRVRETEPKRPPSAPDVPTPAPPAEAAPAAEIDLEFVLAAVEVEGVTVFNLDAIGPLYEEYLATRVGIEEVQRIVERITAMYRGAGYALSRAIAPPQDLSAGVLYVRVIEGYLERVTFAGDIANAPDLAGYAERLKAHRPLTQAALERYTLAIGDLTGFEVDTELKAVDEDAGQYELVYTLSRKAVDGVALINNRGTTDVGRLQTWLSAGVNSALGLGERIEVGFFTVPNEPEESLYREVTWRQPIGHEGTAFSITGALGDTDSGGALEASDVESEFERIGLAIWHRDWF